MSAESPDAANRPASPYPAAAPPPQVVYRPPTAFGRYGKLLLIALGLAIAVIIGQASNYRSYFSEPGGPQEKYHSLNEHADAKIAIISVNGAILDGTFVKQQIDRIRDDQSVVAAVLRVDSPGGTVTGSDYLYHHLGRLVAEREIPLVVSMGSICASGGYYISMAARGDGGAVTDGPLIFAEPTTWTGSIGVVIPHYDLSGLLEHYNVQDDSVASHPNKLMGSPTRSLTPEERKQERQILQQLVNVSFERFKQIVRDGRPKLKDDEAALTAATTGQIFTAQQALDLGLVDEIGFIEEAVARAAELAGRSPNQLRCVKYDQPPTTFSMLMGVEAPQLPAGRGVDLGALLDLAAPRAYYLSTWLPSVLTNAH